jgi:hypothetical protein
MTRRGVVPLEAIAARRIYARRRVEDCLLEIVVVINWLAIGWPDQVAARFDCPHATEKCAVEEPALRIWGAASLSTAATFDALIGHNMRTSFMSHLDPIAARVIADMPSALRALLVNLPQAALNTPNDEGWSVKDIVAHLVDVENGVMVHRINRMLTEERPFIASIDPPARLAAGGYAERILLDLLDELEHQRELHAPWLAALTDADLARHWLHDEVGEIRVSDVAHQWAAHDMAHLRQIALMIQQHLAPLMGNTRGFYDV